MSMRIDASVFNRACAELATRSGASLKTVIESEASRVLGQCVRVTAASAAKYPRKIHSAGRGFAKSGQSEVWVNTTGRGGSPLGRAWLVQPGQVKGKTCYIIRGPGVLRHWNAQRWALAMSLLAEADPGGKLAAISDPVRAKGKVKGKGLAKASWVQIATALGLVVYPAPPAYVMTALPQDGVRRVSGKGRRIEKQDEFVLELENVYPLLCGKAKSQNPGNDGASILAAALNKRALYFQRNLERGWLDDTRKIAQRYPGLVAR